MADKTNGPDLTKHVSDCQATFKQQTPNFIAVDFYDKGSLFETVAKVNGVQWNGQQPTKANGSDSDTGSRSSGLRGLFGSGAAATWNNRGTLGALATVVATIGILAV